MQSAVTTAAKSVNTIIFIVVVLSLLLSFKIDMLWGGINSLQIVAFMSFCSISWSANLSFLFSLLNSITQFDFIDPFSILPLIDRYLVDWKWSPTDP